MLVARQHQDAFIDELEKNLKQFYPNGAFSLSLSLLLLLLLPPLPLLLMMVQQLHLPLEGGARGGLLFTAL